MGSEAISVALYASLLTTNLSGILLNLLTKYSSSIDLMEDWINAVASGNLTAPLTNVATNMHSIMLDDIILSYHNAFNVTLVMLTVISGMISLVCLFLLKRKSSH